MSNVVDERVVEMRFDNKQFESGVQTSMGTLQRLKDALNFNKSAQSLNQLTTVVNTNFSGMSGALQAIQDRFSTMGIIGMTALQELASMAVNVGVSLVNHILRPLNQVQDLIVNGGKQRALNIEQAKYMIQGLGYEFDKLDDDIGAAVNGTRYGYDEAAMAASQLAASGIEFSNINGRILKSTGEELSDMGVSLTAISGVASMANTEYGRIADIFTRVAGNGKLMTMQLQQLSGYGLNIAAAMAKQWGKTEAEVREMVSQGKVDFQMFANAMYDSFADAALKADTTLTGVSANIRAAWKKIGMDFWTPIVENNSAYVKALGKFKDLVNNFIRPVTKAAAQGGWTDFVNMLAQALKDVLSYQPLLLGVKNTIQGIVDVIASFKINDKLKDLIHFVKTLTLFRKFGDNSLKSYFDAMLGKEGGWRELEALKTASSIIDRFITILNGFKSAAHIFISFISALGKGFGTLLGHLFPAADGFLTLGSSIAENVTSFDEWLTKNDIFNRAVEKLDQYAGPVLDFIAEKIRDFANALSNHAPKFDDFRKTFGSLLDGFKKFFGGVGNVISQFMPIIKQALGWIGDNLVKAVSGIGDFLSSLKFNEIVGLAAGGGGLAVLGTIAEKLMTFIRTLKTVKGGIGGNIIETFRLLKDTLMQYQINLKSDILIKIGEAVALLAGSLFILSLVDPSRLWASVGALGAIMAEFAAFLAVLDKLGSSGGASSGKNNPLNIIANNISSAFSSIGSAAKKIGQGVSLVAIAGAIVILAAAVKKLSDISPDKLAQGLIAVGLLMTELWAFLKFADVDKLSMSKGVGLLLLAASLSVMAKAVEKVGALPIDQLKTGLTAIAVLLAEIGIFTRLMSADSKSYISAGIGMIAMAAALVIISKAVESLGAIPAEQLGQGLVGVGLALAGMVTALNLLDGKKAMTKAISITVLAAAMIVMAKAVQAFGTMDVEQMGQGLAGIGASLLAVVLALDLLDGTKVFTKAASIVAVAVAMNIMAVAVKSLGKMDLWSIVKALIAFGGVVAIFAIAGPALTAAAGGMLALGGTIIMFGAGIALLGAGVMLLGAGLVSLAMGITALAGAFATGGVAIVTGITAIVAGIIAGIAAAATALAAGVITFLVTLGNGATQLIQVVVQLGTALIQGIIQLLPQIVDLILLIISEVLRIVVEAAPQIVLAAAQLMVAFIEGITQKLPDIVEAAINLIITFINTMAVAVDEHGPELVAAFVNLIGSVLQFLGEAAFQFLFAAVQWIAQLVIGIVNGASDVVSGIQSLVQQGIDALAGFVDSFFTAGANLVQGLIDGIVSMVGSAIDSIVGLGKNLWANFTAFWDEHSPSRRMRGGGVNIVRGLAIGIHNTAKEAVHSIQDLSKSMYDAFSGTADVLNDAINSEIDLSPTITPVMDLSGVVSSAGALNGMFGDQTMHASLITGAKIDNVNAVASINSKWNSYDNGDVVESINELHNDISDLNNRIQDMNEKDATYEFNLNTQLDGRNIARSTARYNRQELALLDRNTNRKGGKVR